MKHDAANTQNHFDMDGKEKTQLISCNNIVSIFLVLAVVYWFVNFLLVSGNHFISYPIHHDDYTNLSSSKLDLSFSLVRPVSTVLIALLASLGTSYYYLFLSFFTVLYPALVLYFVSKFFETPLSLILVLIFGVFVFSFPPTLEYTKYTGLMTNILSTLFGILSMISLLRGFKETSWLYYSLGIVLFVFSIFAKEDFILPCLLLALYFIVSNYKSGVRYLKQRILVLIGLVFCVLLLYIYNKFILVSSFTTSKSGVYTTVFSFSSILSTVYEYIRIEKFSLLFVIAFSIVSIVLIKKYDIKIKLLFILIATITLIAPYSVLPNHVYYYYAFNWFPWEVSLIIILLTLFINTYNNKLFKYIVSSILFCCAVLVIYMTHQSRSALVNWYSSQSEINNNMIQTLLKNKNNISEHPYIGIRGAEKLSPWSKSSGRYLKDNLGFTNKWIVFVPNSDIFNEINLGNKVDTNATINVLNISEAVKFPRILFIDFDSKGNGTLTQGYLKEIKTDSKANLKIEPLILKSFGPNETVAGKGFQKQPGGESALWAQGENITKSTVIVFNNVRLKSIVDQSQSIVTALVPPNLYDIPGEYPIHLLDAATSRKSKELKFIVKQK